MCHNILFHEDSAGCAMRGSEATVGATFLTLNQIYWRRRQTRLLYQYQPDVSAPKHSAGFTSTSGLTQAQFWQASCGRAIINVISVFLLEDIDRVRTIKAGFLVAPPSRRKGGFFFFLLSCKPLSQRFFCHDKLLYPSFMQARHAWWKMIVSLLSGNFLFSLAIVTGPTVSRWPAVIGLVIKTTNDGLWKPSAGWTAAKFL